MGDFRTGEAAWVARLGNLRNTIRQEVIRRQLAGHVRPPMTVLDVGSGQGTQALELAAAGCTVTGVEPSAALRDRCRADARDRGLDLELVDGTLDRLDALLDGRRFDLACAHGLFMYLDDRAAAVATIARRVEPGGLLSITVRNGHALALRPALRGDWTAALAAFDGDRYTNEIGVQARADRLDDVMNELAACGCEVVAWYGVRVLNDAVGSDVPPPAGDELVALLDAEDLAGRRDPYRILGSQLHVVARRTHP